MSGGTAPCGQSAPWLKKVQHLTHKMVERSTEARTPPICVQRRSAMPAIFACGHSLCTHPNPCRVVKPCDEGKLETDLAPGKKTRVGWNIAAVHRDSQAKSSMPMDRGFWSNACWAPSKMWECVRLSIATNSNLRSNGTKEAPVVPKSPTSSTRRSEPKHQQSPQCHDQGAA